MTLPRPSSPEIEALGQTIEEVRLIAVDARAEARAAVTLATSADNRSMDTHALVVALTAESRAETARRKEYEADSKRERSELSTKLDTWMEATKIAVGSVETRVTVVDQHNRQQDEAIGEVKVALSNKQMAALTGLAGLATAIGANLPRILDLLAGLLHK